MSKLSPFVVSLIVLIAIMGNASAVTYINTLPYEITESGYYVLTVDGINLTSDYGIKISADNVVLDGQEHVIDGDSNIEWDEYGVIIEGSNIVVKNLVVRDWCKSIFVNSSVNVTVEHNTIESIGVEQSNDVVITKNDMFSDGDDVSVISFSNRILIENNTIQDFNEFMSLLDSTDVSILNNTAYDIGAWLFRLEGCKNVLIKNNIIHNYNSTGDGIKLLEDTRYGIQSENVMVQNNLIYNCPTALTLSNVNNAVVVDNRFGNCRYRGIEIIGSENITIFRNKIINCGVDGIGFSGFKSTNVTIYLNDFINTNKSIGIYQTELNNVHFNSTELITYIYNGKTFTNYLGNYYSDYNGNDNNGDGIGDSPYAIVEATYYDSYPLMQPFENYVSSVQKSLIVIYAGEKYIIASDLCDKVYLLDLNNTILWNYTTGYVFSGYVNDRFAVVGSYSVYLFDVNGTLLWEYPIESPVTAVFTDNRFVTAASGMRLYLFDINGTLLWTKKLINYTTVDVTYSISVTEDGVTYHYIGFGDSNGNVYFFYSNGTLAWSCNIGEPVEVITYGTAIYPNGTVIGGYIIVGGADGGIYIFDLNGNLVYHFNVDDCITALYIYKIYVIAGTFKGKVYLLDLFTGNTLRQYQVGSTVKSLSVMENETGAYIVAKCVDGVYYLPINVPINVKTQQLLPKLHLKKIGGKWRLVDENGNIVVFRGVNIPDPYDWDNNSQRYEIQKVLENLHEMGVNVIRVPVHPISVKEMGIDEYVKKYLDPIIDNASKYGMYVIIDWHAIGNPKFKGVCYNPPAETINDSLHTSKDRIKEDLLIIKDFTNRIRTYSVDGNLGLIPEIIHDNNLGLKVYLGVDVNQSVPGETQRQIDKAISLAKKYHDVIEAIVVGNEVFTANLVYDPNYLLKKINEVKRNVSGYGVKVTTAEIWQFWVKDTVYLRNHSNIKPEDIDNIINSVDFVLVHIHPFNDGVSIDKAMSYFKDVWENRLKDLRLKKYVVVGETGWPTNGNIKRNAVPSEENQARFLRKFLEYAHENNIDYFWFEAFDQPWKAKEKGEEHEKYWGLFNRSRILKKIHEGYNFIKYKPARLDMAKEFWSFISQRYKDCTNVIYDIYNEPALGITWNEWKSVAEELIDVIRQNDPDSLIIVGGINFAYDLSGVENNPINRNNIIYATHVYPNRPYDEWDSKWGKIADEYPVMITEWGYDLNTTAEELMGTRAYASKLLEYIAEYPNQRYQFIRVIGWLAWCYNYSADWEPNMLAKDGKLNDFGRFVESYVSPIVIDSIETKINGFNRIEQAAVPYDIIAIPANTKVDININGEYISTDGDTSSKKVIVYIDGRKVHETITGTGKQFKIELHNVVLPYGEHELTIEIDNRTRHLAIYSYISVVNTSGNKFIITRDGYSFKNPPLTFEDYLLMVNTFIVGNMLPIPVGTFASVTYAIMASGGHGYGMSYTASLFHADLEKPPKRPVYSLSWKDVSDTVGLYHMKQLVDSVFLLKLKGAVWDNNIEIAENAIKIMSNKKKSPIIVLYSKSNNKKEWHAVNAIGYMYTDDSIILVIYDNNQPDRCHILQIPKHLNKLHPEKKFVYCSNGYNMNLATVIEPTPYVNPYKLLQITYATIKILTELEKMSIAALHIGCPVDINITDGNGNQLLIINNTVVVNTLNANVFIVNDSKTIILLANRTYTITLIGTSNGSVNITELTPVGNNITALNVTFNVQNGSIVTIKTLNGSAMIKDINIDYDNDGIIDETLKPNVTANVSVQELKKLLAPVASFTYTPTNPTTADTIQFTDQSYDPDGNITAWHWDFGDGTTSNVQNPTHRYAKAGTYTVTLTVTDNDGNTNSTSRTIVIYPIEIPPLPNQAKSPKDNDGDGLYEDLNGNGRLDFNDVVLLFKYLKWIDENNYDRYFDFNGNGKIDFGDVVKLFDMI